MSILISVIIPVYKVEKYLDRCVESIVNQTYTNLEIILVDDGSPDNCPAMCDAWAERDSRIKVIHKENGGVASARNIGLDSVTGNYIAFVDSDDYMELNAFELLLDKSFSDIIIFSNYEVFDDGTTKENFFYYNKKEPMNYVECYTGLLDEYKYVHEIVCNKLYKKSLWDGMRFNTKLTKYEDSDILPYIYEKAKTISVFDSPLYYYYQNKKSTMHKEFDENDLCIVNILYKRICHFKNNDVMYNFILDSNISAIRGIYIYAYNSNANYTQLRIIKHEYNKYFKLLFRRKHKKINKKSKVKYIIFYISPKIYLTIIKML